MIVNLIRSESITMLLSQQYLREDLSRKKSLSYIKILYKIKNSIHINSFMLYIGFYQLYYFHTVPHHSIEASQALTCASLLFSASAV